MEDNLLWKTIFDGRQPLVDDNLWWKTTVGVKRPLVKVDLNVVDKKMGGGLIFFCGGGGDFLFLGGR